MSKYSFMGSNFSNEQVMKMSEKTINALDAVRWTPVCEFPDHYSVDDVGEIMEAAFIVFNPGYHLVGRMLKKHD